MLRRPKHSKNEVVAPKEEEGPCIIIYFYNKTNQMHNISNLFYFGTTLYMFRTVSPSTIRSLKTVHAASGICHTGSVTAC
jgi:hypothetical protein